MLGLNHTIQQTLNITPYYNSKMVEAIDEWKMMYKDESPWLHEPDFANPTLVVSLGLPAFIASEKARMAVLEMQSEITAPTVETEEVNPNYFPPTTDINGNIKVSGETKTIVTESVTSPTERADYMNEQYQNKLIPRLRTELEFGIALGSLIIKPYVVKCKNNPIAGLEEEPTEEEVSYKMGFDFVQADCFYPFAFDDNHNLSEVAFLQTKTDKDKVYTRLEYHKLEGNNVRIQNRVFESNTNPITDTSSNPNLGKEVSLNAVPEWSNLPRDITIKNVDRLLFGYFRMPEANTIDPHSPLGVSGFARAKYLIREADKQYSRLLWEYEGGELAIDIDRDALTDVKDFKGNMHTIMGTLQQRLYRPVDLGESNTYQPYAPQLRDASLINGLNTLLMRIEDVCALSRGTISEVATEARTATELKILKQRSYSSNAEIQKALETALKDVIYAMDVYCTLYNIVGDVKMVNGKVDTKALGKYDVSFTWDDSILVDVDDELSKRLTLMQNGISSKREVRMWYFGESKRQATSALQEIQQESVNAIEQNMMVSSQLGSAVSNKTDKSNKSDTNEEEKIGEQQKTMQAVKEKSATDISVLYFA